MGSEGKQLGNECAGEGFSGLCTQAVLALSLKSHAAAMLSQEVSNLTVAFRGFMEAVGRRG